MKRTNLTAGLPLVLLLALVFFVAREVLGSLEIINYYWQLILDQSLIITTAAIGLSIIYGFAGQFSLGHAAFFGLGAYTAGLISKLWGHGNYGVFLLSLVAGAALAGAVAFLIGLPILRLRSDYLGIATMGFGIIVKVLMDNSNKWITATGGATGMTGVPQIAKFPVIFSVFLLAVLLARNLRLSSFGRAWTAVREDEVAADAMGVDPTRVKTLAFVLGCALAGVAGALYAHRYPIVHPSSFDFLKSFDFLIIVVLGGLGSMSGTIVTGVGWVFLLEVLRAVLGQSFLDFRGVIYALTLVLVVILRPKGLLSGMEWQALIPRRVPEGNPPAKGETPNVSA
ncbi:MAG: branched-chain amino acid ABC transporter permease [Bacillota bacterium]